MASGWKTNRSGIDRFKRVLDKLPAGAVEGIEQAHRLNGEEGVRIIKGDTPRDDGDLERSVDWCYGDPPPGVLGSAPRSKTAVPDNLRMSIFAGGKKAPHAHLVHNGTAERKTKDGASKGVMPPLPFFWPNIRALRKRWRGRIVRRANKAIRDSVK